MILELFGHQRIAGMVSEYTFGGSTFVRVDVPAVRDIPAFTRVFHPNAVYCFNPVDEQTMLDMVGNLTVKPLTAFDLSEIRRKMENSLTAGDDDVIDIDEGLDRDDEPDYMQQRWEDQ